MKELAILGSVLAFLLLIAFQHLLNWGYRQKNDDFPIILVIIGQLFSLVLFWGLISKLIEVF
jgi:hypothetical protein